jgi:cyclopropane fatty-acyl-phospholipid synthase-like methyltransferase
VPSLPRTLEWLEASGLHVVEVEELGSHYQRTAEVWLSNFEARWPEMQAIDPGLFTEHFRRVWTYYLSGVTENFRNDLNLHHIIFTKGKGQSSIEERSASKTNERSPERAASDAPSIC